MAAWAVRIATRQRPPARHPDVETAAPPPIVRDIGYDRERKKSTPAPTRSKLENDNQPAPGTTSRGKVHAGLK